MLQIISDIKMQNIRITKSENKIDHIQQNHGIIL